MKLKAGFLLTKLTNSKEKNEWLKSSYFNIKHISIELNDSIIRGPDIGDLLGVGLCIGYFVLEQCSQVSCLSPSGTVQPWEGPRRQCIKNTENKKAW